MKDQFHGSNILLKGSSLGDHMMNVAGDFISMANLMCSIVIFTNNDDGIYEG